MAGYLVGARIAGRDPAHPFAQPISTVLVSLSEVRMIMLLRPPLKSFYLILLFGVYDENN
jgi:hypothetical protein